MNSINFSDRLKEEIRLTVPIEIVAADLGLNDWTPNRSGFNGPCFNAAGHTDNTGRKLGLVKNSNGGDYFHCWVCGVGGDNIRLVEMVLGIDFQAALNWMIERYRPADLPGWKRSSKKNPPINDGKAGDFFTAADLYEMVYERGRGLLYEPAGKEALDYLLSVRGYNRETLEKTEWIYFPPDAEIKKHLKQAAGSEAEGAINQLKLQGAHGDLFRAALPWRDRRGRIMGFFKRAAVPAGVSGTLRDGTPFENQRQEYTAGLQITQDLFNLHFCKRNDCLVIVEGPPDAAYISRLDLGAGRGIVAVGHGGISESHIDGLKALGIKSVIIAFDNDGRGIVNTQSAIDRLRKSGAGIDVFVIHPEDLGKFKDPDELVRGGGGLPALLPLIDGAASWFNFEYRRAVEQYPTNTDQSAAIFNKKVDGIISQLSPGEWRQLKNANPADFGPGADWDERQADMREQEAKKKREAAARASIHEYQTGNLSLDKLRDRLGEITQEDAGAEPVRSVAQRLREKQGQDGKHEIGQLLGYPLTRFAELSRQMDGVQPGFYIFAGITHVGKTAFLTNIFYDLLETNPELSGIYFSLDDNENVIFNRLLAIGCGGTLRINELQRRVAGQNAQTLAAAYNQLIYWAESGRFNIADFSQIATIETVESILKNTLQDGRELFAVIDGIQNLDTGKESKNSGLRQKNVDLAAGIKRLVDIYKIPVFSSVEIRKRDNPEAMPGIDDIMESGKWGYNASHIWIGHPVKDWNNFSERRDFTLTVSIAKSKISDSPGSTDFYFRRAFNKLTAGGDAERESAGAMREYTRTRK